jgi:stage II sporulation protein R
LGDVEMAADQPPAEREGNPYKAADRDAKQEQQTAGKNPQGTDVKETTAVQPNMEVRFFFWEKLTAFFS